MDLEMKFGDFSTRQEAEQYLVILEKMKLIQGGLILQKIDLNSDS